MQRGFSQFAGPLGDDVFQMVHARLVFGALGLELLRADGDQLFEAHEVKVVVDGEALKVIDGSTLDFVREGLKETFKFDNPNAKSQCGCGESFSV